MSSLDEKIPPAPPGASALLESMAAEHLDRAAATSAGSRAAVTPDADPPLAAEPNEIVPDHIASPLSAQQRADMLRKEIESLLAGEPNALAPLEPGTAPIEPDPGIASTENSATAPPSDNAPPPMPNGALPAPTENPATPVPAQSASPQPPQPQDPSNITQAELEVLLQDVNLSSTIDEEADPSPGPAADPSQAAPQTSSPPAADAPTISAQSATSPAGSAVALAPMPESPSPTQPPTDISTLAPPAPIDSPPDDLESKLAEAHGVMADELAALMSETQPVEPPSAAADWSGAGVGENIESPPTEPAAAPLPAELSAAVQNIMNSRPQVAEQIAAPPDSPPPNPAPAVTASPPDSTPPPASANPSPASAYPAPASASPASRLAAEPAGPGIFARAYQLLLDLVVMVLQIIDMPFGWIKEPDKNVLGIAAFCLLLGGAALYAWSLYLARH